MKVTDIRSQVRAPGRFSVFVDGKYTFSLSDTALLKQGLKLGQELDTAEVTRLKQVSSDDKLYGLVLRYVAMRPRSEWEVRTYLERKHASTALTDDTLNKLSEQQLLNDLRFAQAWVENRRLLRPTSKRKLQQELRAKHVSDEVIKQVLAEDVADESSQLRELVVKKRQQARYRNDLKLMQYLARQGFNYEDIKTVLREEA